MAYRNYIELTDRLNADLWKRRGNNNGGKIYPWTDTSDERKKGVTIAYQGKREDIAVNITTRQMAGAVRRAYKTVCERINLIPHLPQKGEYNFCPAYYEWHLTDHLGRVLLNWPDPSEEFYIHTDEDGNDLDEPRAMTYDEVVTECEAFIECGDLFFQAANDEDEREGYHGVHRKNWERLPLDAAEIMAKAVYEYYIEE